tara:strand:- start:88 stop:309 length:222 start_codon:yes stop_codon:yes gene_type:complete
MSNNELFKTIEAQGRLITELRSELEDIRILSRKIVEYNYEDEEHDYECYENNDKPQSHIFLVIRELNNLLNQS